MLFIWKKPVFTKHTVTVQYKKWDSYFIVPGSNEIGRSEPQIVYIDWKLVCSTAWLSFKRFNEPFERKQLEAEEADMIIANICLTSV